MLSLQGTGHYLSSVLNATPPATEYPPLHCTDGIWGKKPPTQKKRNLVWFPIVISAERVESSKSHPYLAQIFFCIVEESTDIGTNLRNETFIFMSVNRKYRQTPLE